MSTGRLVFDSLLGIMACLGLVLATNAVFVGNWLRATGGGAAAMVFGMWLVSRVFYRPSETDGT